MKTKKSGKNAPEKVVSKARTFKDTIDILEKEYNGKLIKAEDLKDRGFPTLYGWLKEISRFGNTDRMILIFDCGDTIRFRFFTEQNEYVISASAGYLGAGVSTRKPRPGETWTRGNDLPDGPYSTKTWNSIVLGIIRYELKNLQVFK